MERTSYGRSVDIKRTSNLVEGVAPAVATGGLADIVVAHRPAVHSSLDAPCFEVRGDGAGVDAKFGGEIGQ